MFVRVGRLTVVLKMQQKCLVSVTALNIVGASYFFIGLEVVEADA